MKPHICFNKGQWRVNQDGFVGYMDVDLYYAWLMFIKTRRASLRMEEKARIKQNEIS